jgi:hypothetical protein
MKKTAVEWLVEQFNSKTGFELDEFDNLVNQAKEMEKQQLSSIPIKIIDVENIHVRIEDGAVVVTRNKSNPK